MKTDIRELLDFKKVDSLLEGFNKSTGFVTAILDLKGNILSKSGWRQLCTEFHRINPETSANCTTSDTILANKMAKGEKYHFYKCLNGLADVAMPLIINEEHVANLFSGQFFFEQPDKEFFLKQAQKYGFDKDKYLEALSEIPVVSEEKVKTVMDFLHQMTQFIVEQAFQQSQLTELSKKLTESETKFKSFFESANVGKSITLLNGEASINKAFCNMLGYHPEELKNLKWQDITPENEIPVSQKYIDLMIKGEMDSVRFEKRFICKNKSTIWADVNSTLLRDRNRNPLYLITTIVDITERKQAEEAVKESNIFINSLLKALPVAVYYKDKDGKYLGCNQIFSEVTGVSEEQIKGKTICEVWPDENAEKFHSMDMELMQNKNHQVYEYKIKDKNNKILSVLYAKDVFLDGDKNIAGMIGAFLDISEQKKTEVLLRESEEKYRTLISEMINAFGLHEMIFDEKGRAVDYKFLEVNPSWEKIVGITAASVIGKTIKKIMPDIEESWIQFYGEVVKTGIPAEFEDYNAATNKYYQVYAYCPSANKFAVLFNDITKQKLTEKAHQTIEKRLDFAMMIKNEGIWDWNLLTSEVYYDPRYYLMAGYDVNEFPHQLAEFTNRLHPDDVDAVMSDAENHIKGLLDTYRVEFRFRKKDGEYIWILSFGNIVERDENGKPLRFIGTHQDITELKRMRLVDESRLRLLYFSESHSLEELLEETLNEAEKITESKIGFYHFVENDQVTIHLKSWSTRTKEIYCKADGAELKYDIKDAGVWTDCIKERRTIIHNDYNSLPNRRGLPAGHAEVIRELVVPVIRDSKIKAILGIGNKLTNYTQYDVSSIEKLAELAWDIAERKMIYDTLTENQKYLKDINAQKDKFFSIIAHDLKSPFNSILGFSQLLVEQIKEKDYNGIEEYANIMLHSSEHAFSLLTNLLEWSHSQSGKFEFNPEFFELVDFIEEIIPIFDDVAKQKSISIIRSEPHNIAIYADKHMISTILRNLINNAIKFTNRGGEVVIILSLKQGEVIISIKDNGIGIAKERLNKLFRIDENESTRGTENEKGTGLGLILCKEFVEKHKGKIWVESEEGKGSTFCFSIPEHKIM